jgi:hypothetical protein
LLARLEARGEIGRPSRDGFTAIPPEDPGRETTQS